MQNKAAVAANATQHQISQDMAERRWQEDKAAKQLERVQLQMAEWVRPIVIDTQTVTFGWFSIAKVRQPREHVA